MLKKQQWLTELFQVWFDAKEKWKSYFFKVRKTCSTQERNTVVTFDALDFLKQQTTIFDGKKSFYFDRMFSSICIIHMYVGFQVNFMTGSQSLYYMIYTKSCTCAIYWLTQPAIPFDLLSSMKFYSLLSELDQGSYLYFVFV